MPTVVVENLDPESCQAGVMWSNLLEAPNLEAASKIELNSNVGPSYITAIIVITAEGWIGNGRRWA